MAEEVSKNKGGRPRNPEIAREGARRGLKPGEERFNAICDSSLLAYMRDYAYTERITIRAALERAIKALKNEAEAQGIEILEKPKDIK